MVKISTNSIISVSISLFCIVISLFVLFSGLLDKSRNLKISRIFSFFIFSNIGFMLSDVILKVFRGNTEWYGLYLLKTAALLHYFFGPLILASMSFYILTYISLKVKVARIVPFIICFICGLALLLTIVSQFNNMYYFFDEYNLYHRGPLFLLSQLIPLAGLMANMIIIIAYRKAMQRKVRLIFFAYVAFPFIAISLHSIAHGITLTSIGTTLTTLLLYVSVQMEQVMNLEAKIQKTNQELALQKAYYEMLRSHINEVKAARHDLRHHLTVIQSYIFSDDRERLEEYLKEHIRSLPSDDEIVFCKNFAVNSILRYYIDIAKSEGIQVETRVDLTENIGINDSDLCIIFGNCIENATEACRRLVDGKFIKINSRLIGQMLIITIDNSCERNIGKNGDAFLSHKREGTGISSVKAVARKYGGTVQFEAGSGVFQASVLLFLQIRNLQLSS